MTIESIPSVIMSSFSFLSVRQLLTLVNYENFDNLVNHNKHDNPVPVTVPGFLYS